MITITIPDDDIQILFANAYLLPDNKCAGIYRFYAKDGELLYIGKANDIRSRILCHSSNSKQIALSKLRHNFFIVKGFYCSCPVERDIYETYMINTMKPSLNSDKVFTYESNRFDDRYKTIKQLVAEELQQKELDKVYLSLNL